MPLSLDFNLWTSVFMRIIKQRALGSPSHRWFQDIMEPPKPLRRFSHWAKRPKANRSLLLITGKLRGRNGLQTAASRKDIWKLEPNRKPHDCITMSAPDLPLNVVPPLMSDSGPLRTGGAERNQARARIRGFSTDLFIVAIRIAEPSWAAPA